MKREEVIILIVKWTAVNGESGWMVRNLSATFLFVHF